MPTVVGKGSVYNLVANVWWSDGWMGGYPRNWLVGGESLQFIFALWGWEFTVTVNMLCVMEPKWNLLNYKLSDMGADISIDMVPSSHLVDILTQLENYPCTTSHYCL